MSGGLPKILAEVAQRCGEAAALRLATAYGGLRLYVPTKVDETHPIALNAGLEAARVLVELYAGERVEVPRAAAAARRRAIRRLKDQGLSTSRIAAELGISERLVRYALRDPEAMRAAGGNPSPLSRHRASVG